MPGKRFKRSFKFKVIAIFAVSTLVPLAIIALANLYLVVRTREENIVELERLAMATANEKIQKLLTDKSNGLTLMVSGSFTSLQEIELSDLLFLLVNAYRASVPRTLDFIDTNGRAILRVASDGSIVYDSDFLSGRSAATLLADINGAQAVPSGVSTMSGIESDYSQSEDFRQAIADKAYYGPVEFIDGHPTMRLAVKISNQNLEIIGVVSAEIGLDEVGHIINGITLGEQGYLYVTDAAGTVIATGTPDMPGPGGSVADWQPAKESLFSGLVEPDLKYQNYRTANGVDVSYAGRRIDTTGWRVFAEWPVPDAFSVIRNILRLSAAIAFATLLVVLGLGLVLAGMVLKPIGVLTRGVKQIAGGDLDNEIDLETNDEFELLGNQFNEMIKVLKENRKLRDEFVFIAAHELRTPVTAIKGYLSMILDNCFGPVPDQIKSNLDIVYGSNERLVQLVHDLLEIARSDAGKMEIKMSPVRLDQNIDTIVKELKSLADKKGIPVNFTPPAQPVTVMADPYKLNEVLTNVIGNAIKYTIGNGSVDIVLEPHEKYMIVHIADHGIGLTKEEQEKLFAKFYRAQNDETKTIEGTGLGLFICKEIVERMGGEIWVESEKGKGSTFSFRLKLA